MLITLVFLMGIANFALHRAVLSSRHPLFEGSGNGLPRGAGRFTLMVEFVVLVVALALVFQEAAWAVVAYGIYTAANGIAAWLILTRRM